MREGKLPVLVLELPLLMTSATTGLRVCIPTISNSS